MPRRSLRTALAVFLLALLPSIAAAQAGRIGGRVVDAATGQPVAGARVAVIVQPVRSAVTGVDGTFTIRGVPGGTYSVAASHIGHATKTVTGVQVGANGAVTLDISLAAQAVSLGGITVTAARERGSVARALDEQRTAVGVVNSVTSEQIARSPDSDAAQAVQRVSGVTVQDGKYVFVRGLGERYTTTSLNGARIPSPEPERKVVPLDLFPAGLLQSITTSKTFTPDQPGDFSGAQVNIRTREFPARSTFTFSFASAYNTVGTARTLPFAPSAGNEWLAFGGRSREVPFMVRGAGSFANLTRDDMTRIAGSFRNTWSARPASELPNLSSGFSLGGTRGIFGRDVGYLASGTYTRAAEASEEQIRATVIAGQDARPQIESQFAGTTGRTSVLWGGLFNLSTKLGTAGRVSLNNSYNRGADNEARRESGFTERINANLPLDIERLRYVERSVRSNQFSGEYLIAGRNKVDWSLTSSGVERVEPDRSEIVYARERDPATGVELAPAWFGGSNEGAVRTFSDLRETSLEGGANFQREIRGHRIKVGGLYRATDRQADNHAYSISALGTLTREQREARPEEIFDGRYTAPGSRIFNVTPLGAGGSYDAEDRLASGYGMVELALMEKVRFIGGARLERSEVVLNAAPTSGAAVTSRPSYTDVLPSAAVNVSLTDVQNLRFSLTRTLSRPEYRELAPVLYREVLGGESVRGNPELRRALIDNADARWEWYPGSGQLLSFGLFAKRFHDPIERVYLATSGTPVVTFVNARQATNYGLETEMRTDLGMLSETLEPLTVFANATLMRSRIEIGDSLSSKTSDRRPMVGQSPYVLNTGVTYADGGTSATLLFNVAGRRIVSAAEAPLPDVYELPRHVLDLSLRFPVGRGVEAKVDARNLLDEPYEVRQGDLVREYHRIGRTLSVGATLKR